VGQESQTGKEVDVELASQMETEDSTSALSTFTASSHGA
jgi:hypothetical protein